MIRRIASRLSPHRGNIAWAVIGQGLGMVGIAVGTRVLTEQASSATFGEAKLYIGLTAFLIGLVIRPFAQFCARQYHDATEQDLAGLFLAFVRRGQLILSGITGLALMAGLLIYRPPTDLTGWILPIATAVLLVAQSLFSIERGMMITMNRQGATSAITVMQHWGVPLLTALAIAWIVDLPAVFLAAQVVAWGLLVATAAGFLRPKTVAVHRQPFRWRDNRVRAWIKEARSFVTPMLGLGLFHWIVSIGDRYIMAGFVEMSDVGKYAAVYGLISAPFLAIGTLMARLGQPFFFSAAAKKNDHRRLRLKLAMALLAAGISAVAMIGIWLFGEMVSKLLLAEEYRQGAAPLMVWISAGYGFLIIAASFETEILASKKTLVLTVSYGIAAVANIAANLILIPRNGILGAAQATCVTFAVYLLILAWFDLGKRPSRDLGHGKQG